eukprot:gene21598-27636_t
MSSSIAKVATVELIRAGKGTQAPRIKDEYCLCHLSTGDMLREAVKAGTEMGRKAKSIMDAGMLVEEGKDDITGEPIVKRGDDTADKLRTRLEEFHNKTQPVLQYYAEKVSNIEADDDMNIITAKIRTALGKSA